MSESKNWSAGTKVVVAVAAAVGLGWLFKKAIVTSATVGAVGGALFTFAALQALQKAGVVVQLPETPPPAGAGTILTTEAGDALTLKALCVSGKGGTITWSRSVQGADGKSAETSTSRDIDCPFDAAALAKVKEMGFAFWGPKAAGMAAS